MDRRPSLGQQRDAHGPVGCSAARSGSPQPWGAGTVVIGFAEEGMRPEEATPCSSSPRLSTTQPSLTPAHFSSMDTVCAINYD